MKSFMNAANTWEADRSPQCFWKSEKSFLSRYSVTEPLSGLFCFWIFSSIFFASIFVTLTLYVVKSLNKTLCDSTHKKHVDFINAPRYSVLVSTRDALTADTPRTVVDNSRGGRLSRLILEAA